MALHALHIRARDARGEAMARLEESEAARAREGTAAEETMARCSSALQALHASLDAVGDTEGGVSEGAHAASTSSAEGRLELERQRHTAQLARLQFENEELRRATRAKTDKIAQMRRQMSESSHGRGHTNAPREVP